MLTRESFLAEIERFLAATGMAPSAFGRAAVADPNLVSDLRAGRTPGLKLVERIDRFIREGARGGSTGKA
jgi:hypothetical protein